MATASKPLGELRDIARRLYDNGHRIERYNPRPRISSVRAVDPAKPVYPAAIAALAGIPAGHAATVCHMINAWCLGVVPLGEISKL